VGTAPNDHTERRFEGRLSAPRTAYLWSVEPSSDVFASGEAGPGR
jgi:hypothetical protein